MPLSQSTRLLAIKTALGADALAVRTFSLQEQISRLFTIEVELSSEDGEIKFDDVVGHDATVQLQVGERSTRYFHGFVSRFIQLANQGGYAHYHATIVPWLWFLTRASDCRIFQEKSVPDIIEEVFQGHGFSDYKLNLSESYQPKEYCVQYRETDFNFVSRLMEQEGIYYFFEHEDGKHTLVLADAISAHKAFEGYDEVSFYELERGATGREAITDWVMEKEVKPVAFAQTDFDFKKPKTSLLTQTNVSRQHGKAEYEIFDFPGEYLESGDGDHLASVRLDEIQSDHEIARGKASARGLAAGYTFKLKNHPRGDQNREYLITGVTVQAEAGEYASGGEGGGGSEFFACSFACMDSQQQFRAPRLTPKPTVQGLQTAIVSGPSGEEIYTDEHGRVKVQFHWDRHGKSDENSSCWIRVSQGWAGKTWGSIHIPRIGQEVVVECLEGDPDRPLITGRVYNADQTPPYELPANKTQSGLKSRSSKDATSENFNEIRFEDKKGSEELYIHAEKDQVIEVENDKTESVGHDEKVTVDHDRQEDVGGNETLSVAKDRTRTVDGNESISIGKNRTKSVDKDEQTTVSGNRTETVSKDETIQIEGKRDETVGKKETINIGDNREVQVGKNDLQQIGKKYALDAGDEILLSTGSASILMKKDGTIQIKGKDIRVEGSGKINLKASSDVTIKGSQVKQN